MDARSYCRGDVAESSGMEVRRATGRKIGTIQKATQAEWHCTDATNNGLDCRYLAYRNDTITDKLRWRGLDSSYSGAMCKDLLLHSLATMPSVNQGRNHEGAIHNPTLAKSTGLHGITWQESWIMALDND